MTVTSELSAVERSWTGVETVFDTGFKARDATHCSVSVGATVLVRGTQYTSVLAAGGVLQILPLAGMPAAPATLLIERVTPATQETDLVNGDTWDMEAFERELDSNAMRDAETRRISSLASSAATTALAAAQQALEGVVAAVAGVSFFNGRTGNVIPQAGDYTAAQVTNAAATNATNTFTADQQIAKANPTATLNKAASGQVNALRGLTNNVLRWALRLGNSTAEAGANAGSDYEEVSADDAGIETVRRRVRRSDGYNTFFGSVEIGSPGAGHSVLLRRFGTTIGAQFDFEIPSSGSALNGPVRVRVFGNTLEIAEGGGTLRGVRLDLTAAAANAASVLVHAGNIDAILGARLTPVSTTSGTQVDFTNLPPDINEIVVHFDGVSLNGTDHLLVQIGTSSGMEVAGYVSTSVLAFGGNGVQAINNTTGFVLFGGSTANIVSGHMTIRRMSGNKWTQSHTNLSSPTSGHFGAGVKTLAGEITSVRILATGANTFDAGSVNISYTR